MNEDLLHPAYALKDSGKNLPQIPAVDHFAGNEKFIRKAFSLQLESKINFDVTLDLEDGAPVGEEAGHAAKIATLLNEAPFPELTGVRIHDYESSHWRQDVETVFKGGGEKFRYLTLPKIEGVKALSHWITELEKIASRSRRTTFPKLHILIETPQAVKEVWQIAELPHIEVLDFGIMDFISCHHGAIPASCMRSPGQFSHRLLNRARIEISSAALANGLIPSHSVTVDLYNASQAWKDARRAFLEYGFLRMWSIHPQQIEQIATAMSPDAGEIELAVKIIEQGYRAAWGPVQIENRLHDRASYRYFWSLLQRAHKNGIALPATASRFFETP